MHPFEFVLIILAIIFGYKAIQLVLKHKADERGATAQNREASEEVAARLAELEERVQVLERIVTDERADLKRAFRDLADD